MNDIDLNQFQFNYDLTWMAFFQDSQGFNYTRYGGREDEHADSHLSKESLLRTMRRVLKLHEQNAVQPASKYEPRLRERFTPEQIPTMSKMMAPRKEKCIHCHDVGNARLKHLGSLGKLTKDMVFAYPSPRQLGVVLDSDDQTMIKAVTPDSAAAQAGLRKGDQLVAVDKNRVLTFADVTRVLELTPETGKLPIDFVRGDKKQSAALALTSGWKKQGADPGWRASPHVVGPNSGFWAKQLNNSERKKHGLTKKDLALKVVVVWGGWAKRAGIRNGDIVTHIDGLNGNKTIRQLQAHLQMNHNFGDKVSVSVIRKNERLKLRMTLPNSGE